MDSFLFAISLEQTGLCLCWTFRRNKFWGRSPVTIFFKQLQTHVSGQFCSFLELAPFAHQKQVFNFIHLYSALLKSFQRSLNTQRFMELQVYVQFPESNIVFESLITGLLLSFEQNLFADHRLIQTYSILLYRIGVSLLILRHGQPWMDFTPLFVWRTPISQGTCLYSKSSLQF